jgi:hypothetical protein
MNRSGGRKEAQRERGVLSRRRANKKWQGKRKPARRENASGGSGPKRGLSSAQSRSIYVARGATITEMGCQGQPESLGKCEAGQDRTGQGRGWMKRASVWDMILAQVWYTQGGQGWHCIHVYEYLKRSHAKYATCGTSQYLWHGG